MKVWTKEEIKDLMEQHDSTVIKCMRQIYNRQTEYEQCIGGTTEANGVGFNGCDAEILSSFCRFYNERGYLTDKQIAIARKKMKKYARQIAEIANEIERKKEKA